MLVTVHHIHTKNQSIAIGQFLDYFQQKSQGNFFLLDFGLFLVFDLTFGYKFKVALLSVFLKYGVYGYTFDPSFKRPFTIILFNLFENCYKSILQIIFGLCKIWRITKTNGEQDSIIAFV